MGSPFAAVLGIVLVAAAGLVAAISAAPSRAPFSAERLWLGRRARGGRGDRGVRVHDRRGPVHLRRLRADRHRHADPVARAVLHAGCRSCSRGCSRPAVLSILIVGSSTSAAIAPPIAALDRGESRPVLAMSAAAAGYSYAIVDETLAWQREANRAALHRDAELRAGIARSVQQSRVSVLGREVLPVPRRSHDRRPHLGGRRRPRPRTRRGAPTSAEGGHRVDLARRPRRERAAVTWHPGRGRRPGRRRGRPRRRPAVRAHRPHLLAGRGEPFRRDPRHDHHRTATPPHRASTPSTGRRRRPAATSTASPRWLAPSPCARKWP